MSSIVGMRADTWEWSLSLDGVNFGVFDEKDGGEVDSDDNPYYPGGMADQYSLGAIARTGNVTLSRNYRLSRDHPTSQKLIDAVGKGAIRAVGQPLDHDGNPWGTPFTYTGRLKTVTFPTHDSKSNDASMLVLVMTITGKPTAM